MTTNSTAKTTAMLWPTTLAGVLGAAILGVAVLAVPADAGSANSTAQPAVTASR